MDTLAKIRHTSTSFKTLKRSQTTKPHWPNARESVGRLLSKIGPQNCWEAVGPVRTIFQILGRDIKKYLDNYSEPLGNWITWSIYMVGISPEESQPTIIFCCENLHQRKRIRDTIRDSGLMEGYRGIALKHLSRAPDCDKLVQLASQSSLKNPMEQHGSSTSRPLVVFCEAEHVTPGAQIAMYDSQTRHMRRKATVGGFVQIGGKEYTMTAAHALEAETEPGITQDEEELYFTDSDEEDYEVAAIDAPSIVVEKVNFGSDLNSNNVPVTYNSHSISADDALDINISHRGSAQKCLLNQPFLSSIHGQQPELDYALIEVQADSSNRAFEDLEIAMQHVISAVKSEEKDADSEIHVIACTASAGLISGLLSTTPSFIRPPHMKNYQEVLAVRFKSPLQKGDCGSWIVDPESGALHGHIIAGSLDTGIAYLVPWHQVYHDIENRLQQTPVPSLKRSSYASNVNPEPFDHHQNSHASHPVSLEKSLDGLHIYSENEPSSELILRTRLISAFEDLMKRKRMEKLELDASKKKAGSSSPAGSHPWVSTIPSTPQGAGALKFKTMLRFLSKIPLKWEDSALLDKALRVVPLERVYNEADEAFEKSRIDAEATGKKISWGYLDFTIQSLMRWFKRDFFNWVNNPTCSRCFGPTVGIGLTAPSPDEELRTGKIVELYQCTATNCAAYERFPRYQDAFYLLETRYGRIGEWSNCFGMLCRAMGAKVRWVWNAEDHVWIEVFSQHCQRWIHVDPIDELWDKPLTYTQEWGVRFSYCIAFSSHGIKDVTTRYVRSTRHTLPREKSTEAELLHIIDELNEELQDKLSANDKKQLNEVSAKESRELRYLFVSSLVSDICCQAHVVTNDGRLELVRADTPDNQMMRAIGDITSNYQWLTQ